MTGACVRECEISFARGGVSGFSEGADLPICPT